MMGNIPPAELVASDILANSGRALPRLRMPLTTPNMIYKNITNNNNVRIKH